MLTILVTILYLFMIGWTIFTLVKRRKRADGTNRFFVSSGYAIVVTMLIISTCIMGFLWFFHVSGPPQLVIVCTIFLLILYGIYILDFNNHLEIDGEKLIATDGLGRKEETTFLQIEFVKSNIGQDYMIYAMGIPFKKISYYSAGFSLLLTRCKETDISIVQNAEITRMYNISLGVLCDLKVRGFETNNSKNKDLLLEVIKLLSINSKTLFVTSNEMLDSRINAKIQIDLGKMRKREFTGYQIDLEQVDQVGAFLPNGTHEMSVFYFFEPSALVVEINNLDLNFLFERQGLKAALFLHDRLGVSIALEKDNEKVIFRIREMLRSYGFIST